MIHLVWQTPRRPGICSRRFCCASRELTQMQNAQSNSTTTSNLPPYVAHTHPKLSTTPIEQVAALSSTDGGPIQAFIFFTNHLNSLRYTCASGRIGHQTDRGRRQCKRYRSTRTSSHVVYAAEMHAQPLHLVICFSCSPSCAMRAIIIRFYPTHVGGAARRHHTDRAETPHSPHTS